MTSYQFLNPEFFWLLLVLPLLALWYWKKFKHSQPHLRYPGAGQLARAKGNGLAKLRYLPPILRLAAIALVIVALARPRTSEERSKSRSTEGIDIVMAVDVSASMLAQDLKPNRMEALKKVAVNFIEKRPNDRIGLVVYAGESFTQTPLTTDHSVLKNSIGELRHGLIEDGTAIGSGLATTVNRLKDSKAKSKVAILLTDGENNRGEIEPRTAAELAQEYGIRVYTIGLGTKGTARSPVAYDGRGGFRFSDVEVNIDEELLREIARLTEGKYFRATDNEKLQAIYQEIDSLERTKLQDQKFYAHHEKFHWFVLLALGLFSLEVLLRYTLLKSFV